MSISGSISDHSVRLSPHVGRTHVHSSCCPISCPDRFLSTHSVNNTVCVWRYRVKRGVTRLSTRNRNVPVLSEIEMSPFVLRSDRRQRKYGLWAMWETRSVGFPRSGGRVLCVHGSGSVHRPLHRAAPRHKANSGSTGRVSRRQGWSALGRQARRAAGLGDAGSAATTGPAFRGAGISVHCIRRPR